MEKNIDFMNKASNVYRTPKYIIRQVIGIIDEDGDTELLSLDTFFRRTPERDAIYEALFEKRILLNGRRLPSTITEREYVD